MQQVTNVTLHWTVTSVFGGWISKGSSNWPVTNSLGWLRCSGLSTCLHDSESQMLRGLHLNSDTPFFRIGYLFAGLTFSVFLWVLRVPPPCVCLLLSCMWLCMFIYVKCFEPVFRDRALYLLFCSLWSPLVCYEYTKKIIYIICYCLSLLTVPRILCGW